MGDNDYDPIGGHTKEEAEAAYEALFRELHGEGLAGDPRGRAEGAAAPGTQGAQGAQGEPPGAYSAQGADAGPREKVAVVGHKDPDTDCVCSAIAYARLKSMTDPDREYIPFRAGLLSGETGYALRRFGAPAPALFSGQAGIQKAILVDHNEGQQLAEDDAAAPDVFEIIDHHRLGKAGTAAPIRVRCEPYGATCTVIYGMYAERGLAPDAQTAGLLCAGIISDTRLFTESGTAREDRLACAALANTAGVDIAELADGLSRA